VPRYELSLSFTVEIEIFFQSWCFGNKNLTSNELDYRFLNNIGATAKRLRFE
jgi:hypothetical protein